MKEERSELIQAMQLFEEDMMTNYDTLKTTNNRKHEDQTSRNQTIYLYLFEMRNFAINN